jgi:hypothetical protein
MFKAGDVVECIDNKSAESHLTRGNRYVITDVCVEEKCVYLSTVNKFSFLSSRFRLVSPATQLSERSAWPLVPVDPESIPDGWRAVEVTRDVAGKHVALETGRPPHLCESTTRVPRLVIERITPPLATPEFPSWLNPDWWIAMDKNGTWCVYNEPPAKHPSMFGWHGDVTVMLHADTYTDAMRRVPPNRWDEACWRIGN